jgi:ATP-dependent Clp protease adapter protein ClpS
MERLQALKTLRPLAGYWFSEEAAPAQKGQAQAELAEEVETSWRVILFNDEEHTFDEVIYQIIKATGCSQKKAVELTNEVHFKGKANVYEGDFSECMRVSGVLQEIALITEIEG